MNYRPKLGSRSLGMTMMRMPDYLVKFFAGKVSWKYTCMLVCFLCSVHFSQAQTVSKVSGGTCVGDNMVFAFGGPSCTINWIIQTGVSYTIVSSSNTQLTIRFNQPVGSPVVVVTANYFSCSNGQAGGANSAPFGVNGVSSAGSIGNPNATICYGGDPLAFTNTTSASGSPLSYQWQLSTNGGTTWSNISGATSATYDPPSGITVTTQYRRRAGCNNLTSNVVTVNVYPDLQPGSISGNQSGCAGMDPSTFSSTGAASGGNGTYAYQWQQSTNGGSTWSNISGATSTSYNPPPLGVTTLYRRSVSSCGQTKYSNTVTVTTTAISAPTGLTENGISYNQFNAAWNAVTPCATSYQVMISPDNIWDGGANDCSIINNVDTDYSFQTAYYLTHCGESLQDGERYYWRVRACNNGFCSAWSTDFIDLPSSGRKRTSAPFVQKVPDLYPAQEVTSGVYPNPVRDGLLRVSGVTSTEPVAVSYRIIDAVGRPLRAGTFQSDGGLDVSELPGGMFVFQYEAAGQKRIVKVYKE